jgi:hypothetical protein
MRRPGTKWPTRSLLRTDTAAVDGERRAADELPRVWPPGVDGGGGMPPVWPPAAFRCSGIGWPEVLRLLGGGDHPLPEVRGAELRPAPAIHLRLPRQGRGIRAAVRELLLLGHDLESCRVGVRGNRPGHHLDILVSDVSSLMCRHAEQVAAADRDRTTAYRGIPSFQRPRRLSCVVQATTRGLATASHDGTMLGS